MSDLLSIGASGVRAYQGALGAVSENIANSGVAGYVRRTTDLKEVAAVNGGLASGKVVSGKIISGLGVRIDGVSRQVDPFKVAAARTAGADLAKTEGAVAWMDRIETSLSGAQLGARVTGFFTAARTLAADPSSLAARAAMLEAGVSAAGAFRATGAALNEVAAELDATVADATGRLGALGEALAKTNERMARAGTGSAAAASLADQRDRLLEEMSGLVDLDVQTDAVGRATVRLGGAGGPLFVIGDRSGQVTAVRGASGQIGFAVVRDGEARALLPTGGALGGVVDGAQRVADARDELDRLAEGFTGAVNGVQAAGVDLDGEVRPTMFTVGARPTDIEMTFTDPRRIAAAGLGGGPRDGSNLEALEQARRAAGTEAGLSALVGGNAAALSQRRVVADAQGAIRDGAVAARDAGSAVDLDNEAVELLRFQQAYQASSRIIQIARETFQSILEIR